jgi:hypothetical protein
MPRIKILLIISAIAVLPGLSTRAAVLDLGDSGWQMIVSAENQLVGDIGYPYIYGTINDSLHLELDKTFHKGPDDFGFMSPLTIEFKKVSANAVNRIVIRDEYIVNNTGVEWVDFHMQLLVSMMNPEAGFNTSYIPSGGVLENVSYSMPYGYNGNPVRLDFENSTGSGVSHIDGQDIFQPGLAYGDIVIEINPNLPTGSRFGLKEIPTIPEPATAALLALGAIPALIQRQFSKKIKG